MLIYQIWGHSSAPKGAKLQRFTTPLHRYDDEMMAILLEAAKVMRQIEAAMAAKNSEGTRKRAGGGLSVTL